ncbi:TPA: hypothetical protein MM329_000678 [Escherichia coli]|nr:hypothetical protein [Escherichia coli]HBZ8229044.1 hypothetical protein [Escherichia coli]HBZ8345772.1 hypothetical protein [Escherichia coli]HBZ8350841.1 hypothetical protein [Escherichia coli]HBZ8356173.1 hypothetical protein [Escherichia coli]
MANLNSSTKILFKRSKTSGKKPEVADIQPGELFVNLADKSIHTSDGTDIIELGSKLTDNYLPLDGGVLTGPVTAPKVLVSAAQATEANSLTRKDYVDKSIDALNKSTTELANTKVNKAGDTMTGNLTVPNVLLSAVQGTQGNSVARRDYVDTKVAIAGSTMTGKLTANAGIDILTDTELKWNRNTDYCGISFKNTGDGDTDSYMRFYAGDNGNEHFKFFSVGGSSETLWATINAGQVIPANYGNFDARYVNKTGDTMSGNLTVPTVLLSAAQNGSGNAVARKDYVDGRANEKVAKTGDTMTGPLTIGGSGMSMRSSGRKHITWQRSDGTAVGYIYKDDAGDGIHFNNGTLGGSEMVYQNAGHLIVPGTITAGGGYGLKVDAIAKRDGTAFIAPDGNINIPAGGSNGFSAGWLLGQINSRLNTAQTTANNAQTAANNANNNANGKITQAQGNTFYKRKRPGWTQIWSGSMGGGQSATWTQDIRWRTIWIWMPNGSYNAYPIGDDGTYFFSSDGGWIRFQVSNGGKTFKNLQDRSSVPQRILVEND